MIRTNNQEYCQLKGFIEGSIVRWLDDPFGEKMTVKSIHPERPSVLLAFSNGTEGYASIESLVCVI